MVIITIHGHTSYTLFFFIIAICRDWDPFKLYQTYFISFIIPLLKRIMHESKNKSLTLVTLSGIVGHIRTKHNNETGGSHETANQKG